MGQSPTATIFFGYVFNEPGIYPWNEDKEWKDIEPLRDKDWDEKHYYAKAMGKDPDSMKYGELRDLFKQSGVLVNPWGCLLDDSCYFICPSLDGAKVWTSWEGLETLHTTMFTNNDAYVEWHKPLKEFVELMKIDPKGQIPKWHLVASYG